MHTDVFSTDQFRQRDHLAVAQLRELPSSDDTCLARLVQLDGVRLAANLLPVPLSSRVVVNPPDAAPGWVFVDAKHDPPPMAVLSDLNDL